MSAFTVAAGFDYEGSYTHGVFNDPAPAIELAERLAGSYFDHVIVMEWNMETGRGIGTVLNFDKAAIEARRAAAEAAEELAEHIAGAQFS